MILNLEAKDSRIKVSLESKGKTIDRLSWQDKRDLSEKLLLQIDKLLKRNKVTVRDLEDVRAKIDANKSHSSYRILMATVKTLRLSLKSD